MKPWNPTDTNTVYKQLHTVLVLIKMREKKVYKDVYRISSKGGTNMKYAHSLLSFIVCVCVHACARVCVRAHTHVCMRVCVRESACMYVCVCRLYKGGGSDIVRQEQIHRGSSGFKVEREKPTVGKW